MARLWIIVFGGGALAALLVGCPQRDSMADSGRPDIVNVGESSTAPASKKKEAVMTTATATFAAGCFWGVEETFRQVEGVVSTAVGYSGGTVPKATYQDVCTGRTGHAEVVQVNYEPDAVSYEKLLEVFWNSHDPTTLNRQGPDVGTQYRSAIFFHTPEQESAARASKDELQGSDKFKQKIVTEITPAATFFKAEEYHQQYLAKRGQAACHTAGQD